ncbi:MAG: N-acetylneuraminate synthase family protein [Alphaproteobacteria bacterium]
MTAPTVIAEAGVNHNGDLDRALAMVTAAAEAGADYVKFQAFSADKLVSHGARTAAYQADNTGETEQAALLRKLELPLDAFATIAAACRKAGIGFMATAFDVDQVEALVALGMDRIKVASGELTNTPALARFAGLGLPVLLSTGMATLDEVGEAIAVLRAHGAQDITLLHCTSLYPAPVTALNLSAIHTMAAAFGLPVGYSDHSLGDHAAIAAVALGASVIEKHFTLDRSLPGPDHRASLEPDELGTMIRRLTETAAALGDGIKAPAPGEAETARLVRRSWHAARPLPAGTVLGPDDLTLKRPADGLPPAQSPVGKPLCRAVAADAAITAEDIAGPV